MKTKRVIGLLMSVLLVFQMLGGISIPAYALAAPELSATVQSTTLVNLSWNSIDGADTYEVWRSDNNDSSFNLLASQGNITYSDSSVTANNKYRYKVIAVGGSVYSAPSSVKTVYTDLTPPTAPSNLQGTSTMTSITLNWSPSTDTGGMGIQEYNVYGRSETGQYQKFGTTTSASFTHSNLDSNASYYYYVKALDRAQLESGSSNIENVYTQADNQAPTTPTGLTASAASSTSINLSWTRSTDNSGVVSYVVYKSTSSSFSSLTSHNTDNTSYTFSDLTTGTTYYFKVYAKDRAGNTSASSSVVLAVPQSDTQKPTPPKIWAQATSTTEIKVTWSGATDNKGVTGYDVLRAVGSSSTSFSPVTLKDTTSSLGYDRPVDRDTTYRYKIRAKDAAGNISDDSNIVTVTTNGDTQRPSTPENLKLTLVSNTEVKLTWDASTDNRGIAGYNIYRSYESDSFVRIATTGSSSSRTYNNTGLTESKNYRYYIKAYDAAGNESNASDTESIYTSTSGRTDEKTITYSQGGTLEIADLIRLEVPQNALNRNADYKLATKSYSSYTNTGYKTFGQPVAITAKAGSTNITSFDKNLKINFYYTSSELGSTDTSKLGIYYWDETNDVWVRIPSTVSTSSRRVTGEVNHLTVFALLADTTAPSIPTLTNPNTVTNQSVGLSGKAEKNAKVEINLNNSTYTVNADSKGNYSKTVTLNLGRNDVKVRAEDAAGNRSDWSSIYVIYCNPTVQLKDISGHWAEQNILRVLELGITSGYEDQTFKPNRTITRAEFSKFVVSALGYSPVSNPQLTFRDNTSIPTWSQGFVARAVEKGIIAGYSDNTFRANQEITRQEMASMLVRALGLENEAKNRQNDYLGFNDANSIPTWAKGYVAVAVQKGLIKGYSDNTFGPILKASRAEAATMIVKMIAVK